MTVATLVSFDPVARHVKRYAGRGPDGRPMKTHEADIFPGSEFPDDVVVREFLFRPPPCFSLNYREVEEFWNAEC